MMLLKQPLNIRSLNNMLRISVLIPGLFGPTQVLSETSPTHSAKGCTSHRLFISCSRQSPEIKPASGLGRDLIFGASVGECVFSLCSYLRSWPHRSFISSRHHCASSSSRAAAVTFLPPSPSHFSISLSVCPSFLSHNVHPSLV